PGRGDAGNGYRSLVQTARCCLAHALHKSRCVAAQRRSLFFRAAHNAAELEAYGAALAQLRALLGLAQRLLARNRPGCLFPPEGDGAGAAVLREYSTMHNACFYGRCLGFQVGLGGALHGGVSHGVPGFARDKVMGVHSMRTFCTGTLHRDMGSMLPNFG
ncbi:LOW QUALITY PROTEIN: hormone-sensitive lipase-like, partial [Falco biarmicus]|uniref:LOW QUALITY PROTEIN: hormone-sensitive lipase-like n=1 Tax=Falco biarmicus TaxID=345155 RepID=UPI0024BC7B01